MCRPAAGQPAPWFAPAPASRTRRSIQPQRRPGPFATSFPPSSFLPMLARTIAAHPAGRKQATAPHHVRWRGPCVAAAAMVIDTHTGTLVGAEATSHDLQMNRSAGKKTAFVTGASYGVGAATALALARAGFDV